MTREERQLNQQLYGLSYDELLQKALKHLHVIGYFTTPKVYEDEKRLQECLEELLWRTQRSIEDADIQEEIAKVTAERQGRVPWKIEPAEVLEEIGAWWRQFRDEHNLPSGDLTEDYLQAIVHTLWQQVSEGPTNAT